MGNNWIRSCCSQCTAQRVVLAVAVSVAGTGVALGQARAPVPDDAALSKAQGLLREVYGKRYDEAETPDEKTALAKTMLAQAAKTKGDPAGHFVLLRVAKDVAVAAGDVETALEAARQIVAAYDVDAMEVKEETFRTIAEATTISSQFKMIAQQALPLMDEAAASDDYERAGRFGDLGTSLARRARDYALVKQIVERRKKVEELAKAYAETHEARELLDKNPTDQDANLTVGRYLCLVKGDWEKGIPMLALGSDATLKDLAVKELEGGTSTAAVMELADGWWNLGEQREGHVKSQLRLRAAHWYRKAAPEPGGLLAAKIQTRLKQLEPRSSRTPQPDAPRHYFAPKTLGNVMFLDYVDNTWKNNIRPWFQIEKLPSGYEVVCNVDGGHDEKMILFPSEDVSAKRLVTAFTVERGYCDVSLRPRDLAPRGTRTRLVAGKRYEVEVWIEKGTARGTVNGQPMAIKHNDPANYGYYSLLPYRRSSIVLHTLHFVSLE